MEVRLSVLLEPRVRKAPDPSKLFLIMSELFGQRALFLNEHVAQFLEAGRRLMPAFSPTRSRRYPEEATE